MASFLPFFRKGTGKIQIGHKKEKRVLLTKAIRPRLYFLISAKVSQRNNVFEFATKEMEALSHFMRRGHRSYDDNLFLDAENLNCFTHVKYILQVGKLSIASVKIVRKLSSNSVRYRGRSKAI